MLSQGDDFPGKCCGVARFLLALGACALYNAARFVCRMCLSGWGEVWDTVSERPVAQWIEQRFPKPRVAGSIPVWATILSETLT